MVLAAPYYEGGLGSCYSDDDTVISVVCDGEVCVRYCE